MKNLVRENGIVELNIYANGKFLEGVTDFEELGGTRYTYRKGEVVSWEVKKMTKQEIYDLGFDEVDPYDEYLILTFKNGDTSTFRNTHVDMFII